MNAVEIEEAISALVEEPFDPAEFPFAFLEAFGNKTTTIKRLRNGDTNKSDLAGGLLQRSNIHIKVCEPGDVAASREELLKSPATNSQKVKYVLATDGQTIEAELLAEGETLVCDYKDIGDHFGFFLPLAGIGTTKQIRENAFDMKATGRFNKLYIELLKTNSDWDTDERREDLNHFFARLIFCFFAEDTNIFSTVDMFTDTIEQMSESDSSNTHDVISKLFLAMSTKPEDRSGLDLRPWADKFPYVNGGLFSGNAEVPRFSKIARSYLIHIGGLDWTKINPDIFGSMIQAVADDNERSDVGMHYTSVSNILNVLNPLFLDELRSSVDGAGDSKRKLLNIRHRISKIRVFDPACGSGNFLVVAYKEMREIEAEINRRRGEPERPTDIPITNFRGIELRSFATEIARLALIIAKYQCDLIFRGPALALSELLPLDSNNWITCGNALRLDWLHLCPPTSSSVKLKTDDLFETPLEQPEINFENEGGETYICGNPPYLGSSVQGPSHKEDMGFLFENRIRKWKSLDYICCWFAKAADYVRATETCEFAFVTTNSICQGQQVPILWPALLKKDLSIAFAYSSFRWRNLARGNAGVTVVIIGLANRSKRECEFYTPSDDNAWHSHLVSNLNPYLVPAIDELLVVEETTVPISDLAAMDYGNKPTDKGNLLLSRTEKSNLISTNNSASRFIRLFAGAEDRIQGKTRHCIWINDEELDFAAEIKEIARRIEGVRSFRSNSTKPATVRSADTPHRFQEVRQIGNELCCVMPRHSSVTRKYLPFAMCEKGTIVSDSAFALYEPPMWNLSVFCSTLHRVWIATVCGKLKTDYRYSNKLGWNTFPLPKMTEQNKVDLTRCVEDILLARECHFPKTIADLYDPDAMPENLREAHDRNDETLERIYIGRCFKNDSERLEKLFELYAKMTASHRPSTHKGEQTQKHGAKT